MSEVETETETFGQRLNRLRGEAGMSMPELAGPGASLSYISRLERGHRGRPTLDAIRTLATRLGVEPGYLETGEDVIDLRLPRLVALELLCRLTRQGQKEIDFALDETYNVLIVELRDHFSMEEREAYVGRGAEPLAEATTSC